MSTYIAGHYTATWNAVDAGTTETGYEIIAHQHEIGVKDDAFGEGDADMIQAGIDYDIQFTSIDFALIQAILAGQNTIGATNDKVGVLLSTLAKTLVLTPTAGTSAAVSGKTLTATKAILIGDYSWNKSHQLRKIPARFRCLPDASNSNKAFTLT